MTNRIPFRVQPMLATLVAQPFDRAGWAYEEKYDGDRMLAYKEEDRVRLLSRNGKDKTGSFPRIAAAIRSLQPVTLLFDGEVVVFDKKGSPDSSFCSRRRANRYTPSSIAFFMKAKICGASHYPCDAM